jgi:hypothetical protein
MEDEREKRGGSGCAIVGLVLAVVFLPVLYVLSIGPVVWMVDRTTAPWWLEAFYYPLEWLAAYSTTIRDALNWYIDFWA